MTLVMLIQLERSLIEGESLLSISVIFRADCEGEGVGNRVRERVCCAIYYVRVRREFSLFWLVMYVVSTVVMLRRVE